MSASAQGLVSLSADFHIHSCLSPCADLTMSPNRIAHQAREKGLGIIALTDHNASLNCPAFAVACAREGLLPLFGMEMNPLEEAHLLAIFGNPRQALEFGNSIERLLPDIPWTVERFGDQPVVDSEERILQSYPKWLGAALNLGFDTLAARAWDAGAIVVPAHVDRAAFSVYSQLGFLPEGPYSAVESKADPSLALTRGLKVLRDSDSHSPDQIGCLSWSLSLPEALVDDLRRALESYLIRLGRIAEQKDGAGYGDLLRSPEVLFYPERESAELFAAIKTKLMSEVRDPIPTRKAKG